MMWEPAGEATLLADVPLLGAGDRAGEWMALPLIQNLARNIRPKKFSFNFQTKVNLNNPVLN